MENELIKSEQVNETITIYSGASKLVLTPEEESKLTASFDENLIEIRPDGLIFLPQVFWRQRLNQSFGIGQWCLVPKRETKDPERNKLYVEGVLMVRGNYVASAVGEAEYHDSNKQQSWASVWESAKSDCITRCCKDLGIACELWQPQFSKKWVDNHAVKVFIEKEVKGEKKKGVSWRKKDAPKLYNETGVVPNNNPIPITPKVQTVEPELDPIERQVRTKYTSVEDIELVLDSCENVGQLNCLYKMNDVLIKEHPELLEKFKSRKEEINKVAA